VSLIPRSRGGALARFALGAVIVIGFTAATTAVAGLLKFKQAVEYFNQTPPIKRAAVTIPDPGNPQTILLIGSDHRHGTPFNSANTDTMMLVHIDPNSSTINLLSIPRDLKVLIPEGGGLATAKLNSAYSVGGPNLLVHVLRNQVFPDLKVNHIVDVNFGGFEALVNAIGCVYSDVDHRYYNDTAFTNFSSIDIQPGYQPLCGSDALAFVRFRHTDTDIVRNARQQDFLRWAKAQFSTSKLISNEDKLLKIFGQHTQTDPNLHSVDGLINLFDLIAFSAGHAIKQIPFPAMLLPCAPVPATANSALQQTPCYVGANPGAEQTAFHQFMARTHTAPAPAGGGAHAGSSGGPGASRSAANAGLIADSADGKTQAQALPHVGMPVYYPRLVPAGARYCTNATCVIGPIANSYPRGYLIHDQGGHPHSSYRMTLVMNPVLGQYIGVQGTTWRTPPILDSPTQTRVVGGKRLLLYVNGHKLSVVAWRTGGGVYWISNTLTDDVPNQQMIGMAASFTRS
jgi:polyisoprenyl-teichoic acid--peptidoglycan teichoic acid transferase